MTLPSFISILTISFLFQLANCQLDIHNQAIITPTSRGSKGSGYFVFDNKSVITVFGHFTVDDRTECFTYGTTIKVELESRLYHGFNSYGFGYAMYNNSNVLVSGGSDILYRGWTVVKVESSKISYDRSFISIGDRSLVVLRESSLYLRSSNICCEQGFELRLEPGSTLDAEGLILKGGDSGVLIVKGGANLRVKPFTTITIGKRAELYVVGNCTFQGNLTIPDYTVKTVSGNELGFTCSSSKI